MYRIYPKIISFSFDNNQTQKASKPYHLDQIAFLVNHKLPRPKPIADHRKNGESTSRPHFSVATSRPRELHAKPGRDLVRSRRYPRHLPQHRPRPPPPAKLHRRRRAFPPLPKLPVPDAAGRYAGGQPENRGTNSGVDTEHRESDFPAFPGNGHRRRLGECEVGEAAGELPHS